MSLLIQHGFYSLSDPMSYDKAPELSTRSDLSVRSDGSAAMRMSLGFNLARFVSVIGDRVNARSLAIDDLTFHGVDFDEHGRVVQRSYMASRLLRQRYQFVMTGRAAGKPSDEAKSTCHDGMTGIAASKPSSEAKSICHDGLTGFAAG